MGLWISTQVRIQIAEVFIPLSDSHCKSIFMAWNTSVMREKTKLVDIWVWQDFLLCFLLWDDLWQHSSEEWFVENLWEMLSKVFLLNWPSFKVVNLCAFWWPIFWLFYWCNGMQSRRTFYIFWRPFCPNKKKVSYHGPPSWTTVISSTFPICRHSIFRNDAGSVVYKDNTQKNRKENATFNARKNSFDQKLQINYNKR